MVSKIIFTCFVVLLALQRLWELRKSQRHLRLLLARGGREHDFGHFPYMALLHGAWLVAMMIEVWYREFNIIVASISSCFFIVGQIFRLLAMQLLGERWCARIVTLPDQPPIRAGIYRYIKHPNYVGVVIEIAAAPLIHSAFVTSIVFSILNIWLLKVRIAAEERAVYG